MNERQLGKIKWTARSLSRFTGFDKKTLKFGDRQIVLEGKAGETIKKEYEDLPPNIARDTFYNYLNKRYVGISRRKVEEFLKLQPDYQKSTRRIKKSLARSVVLNEPFERCLIDLISSKTISKEGDKYPFTLTCIDGFSKFVYAEPLKNKQGATVEKAFQRILSRVPKKWKQCQSDNGSEFLQFPNEFPDIKFIFSSPHMPQSNGIIERVHGFLKKYTYWGQEKKKIDYPKQLQKVIDLYNDRKHSITKLSPNEVHRTDLSEVMIQVVKNRIQNMANKLTPNNFKFKAIEKGDYVRLVMLKKSEIDKVYQNWSDEVYEVAEARKNDTYKLKDIGGKDDGKVKPYVFQRDYLQLIPKETGDKYREDVKNETKKQQEERDRIEAEAEKKRQEVANKRKERETFNLGFEQWQNFFKKNKNFEFEYSEGNKMEVLEVFQVESKVKKKNKNKKVLVKEIWIAFKEVGSKVKSRQDDDAFDERLTNGFVQNTLKLANYTVDVTK
ncbi:hypothetical protein TrLO_g7401 [Triparma laevis f. longispina]|uniref:Integrase catalytic domain-containing protein n=1 Tax=Triparma laevis f. longispina TaxID=1714387 RepID=A0A9W7CAR4_9STRA|nr:hypothetical protein TrLO_g7401 [Triparma laevis f. longispina]